MFTALNDSGSFRRNFMELKKKGNILFTGQGSVCMVKNCDLCLQNAAQAAF